MNRYLCQALRTYGPSIFHSLSTTALYTSFIFLGRFIRSSLLQRFSAGKKCELLATKLLMINIANLAVNFENLPSLALWGLHVQVPLSSARCLSVRVRCHSHNHSFGRVPGDSETDLDHSRGLAATPLPNDVISDAEQQNGQIYCESSFPSKTFR